MRRTIWTMSASMMMCAVLLGQAGTGRCESPAYGPRAVYSPLQKEARGGGGERLAMSRFAFGQEDSISAEKPVIEEIKKPGRAFFLSVLVPGWGQLYSGARTRGLVFFGVEATAVTVAIMGHLSGSDKRDKFEGYADQYWSPDKYEEWYQAWEDWYDYPYKALDPLENHLTHSLPDDKDRDYYEMIGKYDQFLYGWDDVYDHLPPDSATLAPREEIIIFAEGGLDTVFFDPFIGDVPSSRRDVYMDMRYESNKAFKRAKTMVGVILFNHVISAIDAARSARNYNVKHAELKTTLRMEMKKYEGEHIPQLVLTHRFY